MICEGYRTQRGVTGAMNFKSRTFFYGKSCSRDFGPPGCHPSTLIDLANKALASNGFVKAICLLPEGYRNQRGVTGPMNFEKRRFFFRKLVLQGYWGPGCHPDKLIDLANTALASRSSLKAICMISSGYRTHRGVTGPTNFKKSGGFFSKNPARGILGPLSAIQTL